MCSQSFECSTKQRSEIAWRCVLCGASVLWENVPKLLLRKKKCCKSLVTTECISKWQGLFDCILICLGETQADSQRRQEEGTTATSTQTENVSSSLARMPKHPDEKKSRRLKVSDMCHGRSHWASAPDVAQDDSIRATGAGCGTFKVWCVSHRILVLS